MEQAPTLDTVNQALQALYNNPDVVGKEKASVWLGELQRSVFAWQIADQLLRLNQSLESCYFAAQTMRTKIQYAFHELPQASHQSLRDSLLEHAGKITPDTPAVIVTQLSLALADLALEMATWKDAVSDLIQKFGSNMQQLPFLLEVLTVMPEEINSRSLRLGANRRTEITEELGKSCPLVIQLLAACVDSVEGNHRVQAKVFRVLGSWFSVGAIPSDSILNTKLLQAPFQALASRECPSHLHEAATDCVCSALYCTESLSKNPAMAQHLFEGVLTLPTAYHLSVADEDSDKSVNYCRIFTEMAESFLESIVSTPNQALGDFRTLELLLTCVGHHLYEVAEITFNFWYRLSEELYQLNSVDMNEIFKPYIQRLIVALSRHCQMEPDHEGVPDDTGDFGEFRLRVSELIKDVVFIVGSSSCFSQMFENLKNQASSSWDLSESSLFVMSAVAKNILPDENEIVPQVLEAVLSLPNTAHVAVQYSSIQLIGELCEWIERHPQYLDPVLQYLLAGLQQPLLASISANSLQSISTQCRDHMIEHFSGLIQIVQAMGTFNLSNDAAIGLLKGTATILGRLPHGKVTEGLQQLCSIQLSPLNKLISEESGPVKHGSINDPTLWLDRLAAVFRFTNPSVSNGQVHPCQPVIQEVWPVLSNACNKYQADVRIIERCCRCIRFAIRCLGKNSATLLTPLVTQMVSLYQVHQHSCFLYLGSILVDEYGTEQGCIPGLLDMLQAFCGPTFKILEEHNGLRNHPDTVDDLFRLCLRFIQRSPASFLQSQMAKPLLCCAIAACSLDHKDANASVMKFLTDFIKCAREKEDKEDFELRKTAVTTLLNDHGQALVHACINACIFCLPTYMIPDVAEVLYELMLIDRATFCVWLETTLTALPTESSGGAITATKKQLTDFHKTVTSAEHLKPVSHAIRDFSRLYR
ncbi:transportin-3-like [Haliotis rubra]|uniref:transportin-3-like n=1 Tax=Haliotis rubra TaxID=36100 RepID=UPI001EE5894F|nr:transportin-3-like [Haliotis rubra]